MTTASLESKVAVLEALVTKNNEHISEQKEVTKAMQIVIDKMKSDAVLKERKDFRTGISLLGGTVVTLAGIIWSYRTIIIGG